MSAVADIGRIAGLWHRRWPILALGAGLSIVALLCGVALTVSAGRFAVGVAGIVTAATLLHLLGVGRIVLRYVERLVTHDATFRSLADLRVWFFRRLAESASGGLGFRRSGDLLSRLVADVEALDALYLRIFVPLLGSVVLLPCLFLVIGLHDWVLGVLVTACFALSAFALPALAARLTLRAGATLTQAEGALRTGVLDAITGLRELRVFGAEDRALADAQARESRMIAAQLGLARRASIGDALAFLLGQGAMLAVLVAIVAGLGHGGHAAFAAVAVFLVLSAFEAAGSLPRAGVLAGHAIAGARRVLEVASGPPPAARATAPATLASSAIRFEDVSFAWAVGRPVLRDLTLDIPQGARVAILGPSGAGKSTLAQLLLGAVRPDHGHVTFGGLDLDALPVETVRERVALLSQATHLFADTIGANLRIGQRDATDARLWAALDAAAIGDWVRSLPEGLDTWLGEGGTTVSGGQGRRLALARTLLSRAGVLILDEPASGLDGETERAFLSTLFGAQDLDERSRTIILIAHRLTGVERLDRIWRLQGGRAAAAAA